MKKRYFRPETTVVTVRTQQLMQTSGKVQLGENISKQQSADTTEDIEPNRSREDFRSDWDDEDDDI